MSEIRRERKPRQRQVVPVTLLAGGAIAVLCFGFRVWGSDSGVLLNQRLSDAVGWLFYAVPLAVMVLFVLTARRRHYRRAHLTFAVLACVAALGAVLLRPFDDSSDPGTTVVDAPDGSARLVVASVPGVILDPMWRVRVEGAGWFDGSSVLGCIDGDWHEPTSVEWIGTARIRGVLDEGDGTGTFEATRDSEGRWHAIGLDDCQR